MKKQGILLVAFGKEHLALARVAFGQKSILEGLPVHVLTDQAPKDWGPWPSNWTGENFGSFNWTHNRWVRTNMNRFSPFERTLYLDTDQVVKKRGLTKFFDDSFGRFVLNPAVRWNPGDKIYRIYRMAFDQFQIHLPVTVYNGSIIRWDKGEPANTIFHRWHENWVATGSGRDMASLTCAIQQCGVVPGEFPKGWYAGSMREEKDAIIQHDFGPRFRVMYGLPKWPENKPYDKGREVTDWQKVKYENPRLQ